jgi:hypothetical protein
MVPTTPPAPVMSSFTPQSSGVAQSRHGLEGPWILDG